MSRLAGPRQRGPFVRYVLRQTRKRYDRGLEPVEVMAHHRLLLVGMGGYELAMERAHKVDEKLKSLAETKAALVVGCEFCIDIGSHVSARNGVTDEQLMALPHHRDATCFNDLERLVIDYAEAMTNTPAEVTDELFERLREHLDEAQIVELTAGIAWENWRARFNWALGIGAAGFRDGKACPLPQPAAAGNGAAAASPAG
jgi:4-carboxymuconolactone decarboxylase